MNGFDITFWGVRGTMPTPRLSALGYGGHTSCVQMQCGDALLVFDAGTGLHPLSERVKSQHWHLFLSHTHIDHILGFPFFTPAYDEQSEIHLYAGHLQAEGLTLREVMSRLMSPPLFPLTLDDLKASLHWHDFLAGDNINAPSLSKQGIEIQTLPLHHPDRATGYRVNYQGKSACYITDLEHMEGDLDKVLIEFVNNADLLIYDATYDDRQFDQFKGWGHSTWQQAVRIANAANVARLALFHHDAVLDDTALDQRTRELHAMRPNDVVAKEGLILSLG